MTTTVFTACGDDDEPTSKAEDNTPKKVSIGFVLSNTADMLKYCDIELSYDNGKGKSETVKLNGDNALKVQLDLSSELPATFKVSRKVTLKQDIENPTKFEYTNMISYKYALYNAADKKIGADSWGSNGNTAKTSGLLMEKINQGLLDYDYTFAFNSKGEVSFSYSEEL
jgi:hypothetical protein